MATYFYFHSRLVRQILDAVRAGKNTIELSLDLNLSVSVWPIEDHCLILDTAQGPGSVLSGSGRKTFALSLEDLEPIADAGNKVFCFDGESLLPVEVRADGYYKLVPTSSAPTLEINGIKMHRSKDIDPLEDARLKTQRVVRPGDIVLDTCGGLGYSALFAVKAGAKQVVSTEKSRQVMEIRQKNPWIRANAFAWFTREAAARIELENADISRYIQGIGDQSFEAVIHDPPRFCSATGDLYGKDFYRELARVVKPRARLFHYTGSPRRIKEKDRFINNAVKRLETAGFDNLSFDDRLQGILGTKAVPLY
ncbi:MAG: hypothetical protein HUK40_08655 [Desulfobacter sp.]|nr:hypothetical protein [Desulfobacter sp.]WDP84708.1 MAG: hypothetical protein HUN05_05750 [Desulfobacter sp.]